MTTRTQNRTMDKTATWLHLVVALLVGLIPLVLYVWSDSRSTNERFIKVETRVGDADLPNLSIKVARIEEIVIWLQKHEEGKKK